MAKPYNLPMLDLECLRCFLAAAERLNFRMAAESVHLSPAAFGAKIKKLEDDVGAPLFARSTRTVRLTDAGTRLIPQAQRCLAEVERCLSVVSNDAPLQYAISLGTRYELGLSWLLPALERLKQQRPERSIHLYFGDSHDLLPRVLRGGLDAMVTSARLGQTNFQYAHLHEEDYVFVATPKVVRAHKLRGPEDAAAHTLIDAHPDLPLFGYVREARPSHETWRFGAVEYMGTIAAVRVRVLAHAGVAVLPEYFVREDLARGRMLRLLPNLSLPSDWFRLVWRTSDPRGELLSLLAEDLRSLPLR
jgi:LysR family glycine cleavage system transcriptional activator